MACPFRSFASCGVRDALVLVRLMPLVPVPRPSSICLQLLLVLFAISACPSMSFSDRLYRRACVH